MDRAAAVYAERLFCSAERPNDGQSFIHQVTERVILMKKWSKLCVIAIGIVGTAAFIAGCGSSQSGSGGTEQKAKVLRVGTEATYPPFEFAKDGSAELQGFDIDLVNAVAKRIGYTTDIRNMGFDALIPAITSKQLDVAISGMSITPEREKIVNFTTPYYDAGSVIVTKASDTSINTLKDLEGKVVAAQIASTGSDEAKAVPGVTVKDFNDIPSVLQELRSGGVVAAVFDEPVAAYYLKLAPGEFRMIRTGNPSIPIGMAINKENTELLKNINKALADMKADGEYNALSEKWFGTAKK